MLFEWVSVTQGKQDKLSEQLLQSFEKERLRVYGYLGMFAPQEVMDAQDALMNCLLSVIHDGTKVGWETIRNLSLAFLNAVRNDVGINKDVIEYRGKR